ncbi:MAG TPA: methyltransferase [Chitinophagaceae bacterium]|nr:methyltransferase [Chitinophagaceae bacterium]
MSNDYFQFKQFRIAQEHCAMKVSTDACIQAAWTPLPTGIKSVLDIGTGTGLLSLMIAQRCPEYSIDAIEIDQAAAVQAAANVRQSVFADHIQVYYADVLKWEKEHLYDLVLCNPPFFTGSLKGPDAQRNLARHTGDLNLETLAGLIARYLAVQGAASVLLPVSETGRWHTAVSDKGLFVRQVLWVKPFEHSKANRAILICSRQHGAVQEETLVIYREPKVYTAQFTELLRPFYLNL